MRPFTLKSLYSGGVITNYYCSSRCGHCLYGCSPNWQKQYIDKDTARQNLTKIKSLSCRSIHVGGGEPMLDHQGLLAFLNVANELGVGVEYIETNSSWYKSKDQALELLGTLLDLGVRTMLVSISPFHNEYIPFRKVKGVIAACGEIGMNVFPWIANFADEIDRFDSEQTHELSEYQDLFGSSYLDSLASRYHLTMRGRALKTFEPTSPKYSHQEILERSSETCGDLADSSHFHVDLFGNYIPGLCAGFSIKIEDLGAPLSISEYPLIVTLYNQGVRGLTDLATNEYGFKPSIAYSSKCDLCQDIRSFLMKNTESEFKELAPKEFYNQI